jgi:hypothetical protein
MGMETLGDGMGCEWMHHEGVELCYFIHLISIPLNQNLKWTGGANGNYGYVRRLHCYMCGGWRYKGMNTFNKLVLDCDIS